MGRRGGRYHRPPLRIDIEFGQRAGQSIRIPSKVRAGGIRLIFARTRHGKLDQHGRNRAEDEHQQRTHSPAATLIAIPEEKSKAGQIRNRAGNGGCNRTDQDVAVIHVTQFMRQHTLKFLVIQEIKNALRHRNGCMARIASGGERIRRIGRDNVDLGHRQPDALRHPLDHVIHPR